MAIYNYRCRDCETLFERVYKIADRNIPESEPCPECGHRSVYLSIQPVTIGFGLKTPNMKHTDSFNDRMKEIKKRSGKDNVMSDAIR